VFPELTDRAPQSLRQINRKIQIIASNGFSRRGLFLQLEQRHNFVCLNDQISVARTLAARSLDVPVSASDPEFSHTCDEPRLERNAYQAAGVAIGMC
jgi:hypothetical protein